MSDLEQIGIDAVDRFLTTWNSRDKDLWASSLNYPHVRPGPLGKIAVAETAEIYASRFDYQQVIDTGWDHSEWDYRQVLHTSAEKVHVAGQWSRYSAAGEKIHTNPIIYVVTRVAGQWGIQARFAADYAGDEADTSGMESRGFKLVEDFVLNFNNNNQLACSELMNYPHFGIGIGQLRHHATPDDYGVSESRLKIESLQSVQTGNLSMNIAMDVTVENASGSEPYQAVLNITLRDGHLGIQAWSLLDPHAHDPEDEK